MRKLKKPLSPKIYGDFLNHLIDVWCFSVEDSLLIVDRISTDSKFMLFRMHSRCLILNDYNEWSVFYKFSESEEPVRIYFRKLLNFVKNDCLPF